MKLPGENEPCDPEERALRASEESGSIEPDLSEDELWYRLTAEQFLAGYDEADAAYDTA